MEESEIDDYLRKIEVTEVLEGRVSDVLRFYENSCPDPIEDIFLSEAIDEGGVSTFTSLWLFSENFLMEAKSVTSSDEFDFAAIGRGLDYLVIRRESFEDEKPTAQARVRVEFILESGISGELVASGKNCEQLLSVVETQLRRKLIKRGK